MAQITGQVKIKSARLKQIKSSIKNIEELKNELKKNITKEATQFLEIILIGSINLNASDIHLEPEESEVKLRLRIDGMLNDIILLPTKTFNLLLPRIKLLSGIKLNITNKAQDGRFTILLDETQIEMRVSALPSEYGESLVLRILDPKSLIELEELGVREDMRNAFNKQILKPNGMLLVTGPTGCGKTTTLYAILKKIQRQEIKIITIEDPIEYHLDNVSQTQVKPEQGYDFATGLEAIVRQDPDVILVGEIRDAKTSKIAIQASLTGHLVLSTLHTNDAIGSIARFEAFKEKPSSIASAVNMTLAQRLVRRVCKKCVKMETPTKEETLKIKKVLGKTPTSIKIPRVNGCKYCNSTGYKGRAGIFEFFINDEEMKNLIIENQPAPVLRKKAREKGMVSMQEDGFIKIMSGITTIEEIERVMGV